MSGCVGIFASDGTSVSFGTHADGGLLRGVALPFEGTGYEVAAAWRQREQVFGTEGVVRWLAGAFRSVSTAHPGGVARVGDLSPFRGGRSGPHKSHASGRDVDIFFYAVDLSGRPYHPAPAMLRFGSDGRAMTWSPPDGAPPVREPVPLVVFDARRTWALVRSLVSDPEVQVQWIFIHRGLAALLVREAVASGEEPALVARAAALLHQPRDAEPHDDHMHVRIYCPSDDRAVGCLDRGPQRWWKKHWKRMGRGMALAPAD